MSPTVLVVDDEVHHREICSAILRHHGYEVLFAENGRDGVRIAQEARPNVILMDLWMPVLGGAEAVRRLKQNPETAEIPVIAFTAAVYGSSTAALIGEGFASSIEKPCHPLEVLRAVQQIVLPPVIATG